MDIIIIIKQDLLILSVCLMWTTGLIDGNDVKQPSVLWMKNGENATIHCSHTKGASYYLMYWYRQLPGETMKQIVFVYENKKPEYEADFKEEKFPTIKPDAHSGTLIVNNLVPEDKGLYFCAVRDRGTGAEAYFGKGTKLTVLESGLEVTEPTVKVLKPSQKECRNSKDERKKKTLVCVASRFYPDHVSVNWEINGANVEDGVATDNAALRDGSYYKITSRLRVFVQDWNKKGKNFTCIVSFFNGKETITVADTILGVKVEGKNVTREKYMRITHTAKFSYGVFIAKSSIYGAFVAFLVWKLQGSGGKWNN